LPPLEETIAARAKGNQACGQGGVLLLQKSAEAKPIDTRAAELSGSSKKNIQRAKPIVQNGIPARNF